MSQHEDPTVAWITYKDAAERLRVHPNTIKRYVEVGLLHRYFKGGLRAVGVTVASIEAFERGRQYKNDRERGLVDTLPHKSKHEGPLKFALVTGQYPRPGQFQSRPHQGRMREVASR